MFIIQSNLNNIPDLFTKWPKKYRGHVTMTSPVSDRQKVNIFWFFRIVMFQTSNFYFILILGNVNTKYAVNSNLWVGFSFDL